MGFLEDMETILSQLPEERQTLMFSATMPQAIADIAKKFQKEIESDADTFCIMEDNHNNIMSTPPTKMKNPGLFKPFEMYVEMYGLPSYNEIDPTILIGITYSILFGFMFGDAGQGLCLLIGGFLLYKFKKCVWQALFPAVASSLPYSACCSAVCSDLRISLTQCG